MISLAFLLIQFSFSYKASVTIKINQNLLTGRNLGRTRLLPLMNSGRKEKEERVGKNRKRSRKKIIRLWYLPKPSV